MTAMCASLAHPPCGRLTNEGTKEEGALLTSKLHFFLLYDIRGLVTRTVSSSFYRVISGGRLRDSQMGVEVHVKRATLCKDFCRAAVTSHLKFNRLSRRDFCAVRMLKRFSEADA